MLELRQLLLGPMANFVYLLADPELRECAVVDPSWDVPAIREAARTQGWEIKMILVTHHHPDHINGIGELLRDGALPVFVHQADTAALKAFSESLRPVQDGTLIRIGGLSAACLHTPGHTRGSQCLLADGKLLTGDTLFIGGCGRVDLSDSEPEKMYGSLRRLSGLPGDTMLYPGHGYGDRPCASLDDERKKNPYLRLAAKNDLAAFLNAVGS